MKSPFSFRSALAALCIAIGSAAHAGDTPLFPFAPPWDVASPGATDMSGLLDKPAGAHGFIAARDGHLFAGAKRIRLFGVNTVFGACFPNHDDAPKIAARMAKFGVGCVRFHHMDMSDSPGGIWMKDKQTLDPGQLDKLDFFIAQLKAHGIYADLNLHVSRTYPGFPQWTGAPGFCKGIDLFHEPMIEMQREYARQLLTHVNSYTKKAYVGEPAVAIVEINNEDGLIYEWSNGSLDDMSECYRADLEQQWNRWLAGKYPTPVSMNRAWAVQDEPLGAEMLRDGNFEHGAGDAWYLEQHQGAKASVSPADQSSDSAKGPGLRLMVDRPGSEGWHVQLTQTDLSVAKEKCYTISFRAKADSPRRMVAALSQAHAPWEALATVNLNLTTEWNEYHFTVQPTQTEAKARFGFSQLSAEAATFSFRDVSVRPGGRFGFLSGERLGAMPIFKKTAFAARTVPAQRDWMRFLWDTEEHYWTGMARFLKRDLGVRSVLVGTAADFSPSQLQAKLDAVDAHSYWHHPHFPHKPWDMADWTVENRSMAGDSSGGTIPGLAWRRIAGKPIICTEYNAAAPNTFSSETFLLLNAYAALQDWDAVFAFAWSHRTNQWNTQYFPNFFDIDRNGAVALLGSVPCREVGPHAIEHADRNRRRIKERYAGTGRCIRTAFKYGSDRERHG